MDALNEHGLVVVSRVDHDGVAVYIYSKTRHDQNKILSSNNAALAEWDF